MQHPQLRADAEARFQQLLPLIPDYLAAHAARDPAGVALIEHNTGAQVSWKELNRAADAFAAKLLSAGLRRGDVVCTSLPFLKEHVFLMMACFRVGLIIAPLDLRLKAGEIKDAFAKVKPRAWFFLGKTPVADFRPMVEDVLAEAPYCGLRVQFQPEEDGIIPGAQHVKAFASDIKLRYLLSLVTGSVRRAHAASDKRSPCLIIFTTGSTGSPKPALLCHENILVQNIGLKVGFGVEPEDRMLVNLPPSHVGGVTEQLLTSLYAGTPVVLLHIFDAQKSLEAIQEHKVTICGQIPALFHMEWRLPDYDRHDLSSLRFAIYGGQAVDRPFLERLGTMATQMGSGLGLTETAGFCTFTPAEWGPGDVEGSIGYDSPLCPISIREPMQPDGTAGAEKAPGETGEICFSGPQVFLGYLNDEQATRQSVSTDGVCYTGDLGYYDERGLHFVGRSKFVIKPKGYQVHPGEVESLLTHAFAGRVSRTGVVGVPHAVFSEGIVAFLELAEGASVSRDEVAQAAQDMAAYKRPGHVVFLDPGQMPLNRVAKVDYMVLGELARAAVDELRAAGGWDA